jgi:hypothetical protein
MCRYGTGDLQRWPYNKVTIQVEGNHKESLSKEREGGNAKAAFPPFIPCSFNSAGRKRGRNGNIKNPNPDPVQIVFEGEDSSQPQSSGISSQNK